MIKKRNNILKIAIDSPAAAGAGTLGRAISNHYNLSYLEILLSDQKLNYFYFL